MRLQGVSATDMLSCSEPRKGLILHSGAIGDCVLTLPLAVYMKQACGLSQVHFMGRPEAIGCAPGRSGIDHVRAMESVPLHRLFASQDTFELDDPDRLVTAFKGYEHIVSFLGVGHPDFEQNLLMTVHCSHSAEVTLLPMAPPSGGDEAISRFYVRSFAEQVGIEAGTPDLTCSWLTATAEDLLAGSDILQTAGVNPDASIALIHPGSGGCHKCWHPTNFLELAKRCSERGFVPVFLLGPAEQERLDLPCRRQFEQTAPVIADLSLTGVFQLLTQAALFVGNDSGISHIAGALGKKTAVLFGPTDAALYRPLGPSVTVFQARSQGFEAPCLTDVAALLLTIL